MINLDKKSIDGLYFNQTCLSYPKKYEVYDENNNVKQIAFIIEYENNIKIICPNEKGQVISELNIEKNIDYTNTVIKMIQDWCNNTGR